MKIQQTSYYRDAFLMNTTQRNTESKNIVEIQKHLGNHSAVDIDISDEGMKALREKLKEIRPEAEEPIGYELTIQDTNEVEWEHYNSMREYSGLTLKDGNYNLEDVMKSMLDAYEVRYNQIVKEHENGDRQVSYDLTGENTLTLEEDLTGLDSAYNRRLANLAGYIVCQQTNKAFEHPDSSWYFRRNDMQNKVIKQDDYNYFNKEYQNTAVSMMEKAQKKFLEMREKPDYKEGVAKSIIWDIMSDDMVFMENTQKLFAETIL